MNAIAEERQRPVGRTAAGWLLAAAILLSTGTAAPAAEVWATIHFAGPASVLFSPDSKLLLLQGSGRLEVWDIAARKRLWSLPRPRTRVTRRQWLGPGRRGFSPDSKLLAIAERSDMTAALKSARRVMIRWRSSRTPASNFVTPRPASKNASQAF